MFTLPLTRDSPLSRSHTPPNPNPASLQENIFLLESLSLCRSLETVSIPELGILDLRSLITHGVNLRCLEVGKIRQELSPELCSLLSKLTRLEVISLSMAEGEDLGIDETLLRSLASLPKLASLSLKAGEWRGDCLLSPFWADLLRSSCLENLNLSGNPFSDSSLAAFLRQNFPQGFPTSSG